MRSDKPRRFHPLELLGWNALIFIVLFCATCVLYRNVPTDQTTPTEIPPRSSTCQVIDLSAVKDWQAAHPWRAKEELFHFVLSFSQSGQNSYELSPDALSYIGKNFSGLFPVASIRSARFSQRILELDLGTDQSVPVSSAIGQIAVALTKRLAFRIEPIAPGDPNGLRFTVMQGGMRLNFSWCLKTMGKGIPGDIQCDAFLFAIDPDKKNAVITTLREKIFPRNQITIVAAHPDGKAKNILELDLLDPDFPATTDLTINAHGYQCHGSKEKNPGAISDAQHRKEYLSQVIHLATTNPEALLASGIRHNTRAMYWMGSDKNHAEITTSVEFLAIPKSP